MERFDVLLVTRLALFFFCLVFVCVLITNLTTYLILRKKMDKTIYDLMKRLLIKAPIVCTLYSFLTGLGAYVFLLIVDCFLNNDKASSTASKNGVVLVMFPLFGFLYGAITGIAFFFKNYKTIISSEH